MTDKRAFRSKGRSNLPKPPFALGKHLIYSEGTRTEPFYAENIKRNIAKNYSRQPNEVLIIPVKGDNSLYTTKLVKYAFKDVEKRLKNGEHIDHVWILFDKDNFKGFDKADETINARNNSESENVDGFKYEKETGISWHSCPSNQCFELWLILYFHYYEVAHDRKEYADHLEKSTPLKKIKFEYDKNLENLHDIITANGGSIENAVKNAKRLRDKNGMGDPSTGMFVFGEYFLQYLKK